MTKFITDHFPALLAVALGLIVGLFVLLRADPKSRKALKQELWLFRTVLSWFKPSVLPKPGEPDPLAETQMPFKAVLPRKKEGES